MVSPTGRPRASSRGQPKTASACGFQSMMSPLVIDADKRVVSGIENEPGALGVFAKLFFRAAAGRDVPEHALHAAHLAIRAQDRRLENLHVDDFAVGLWCSSTSSSTRPVVRTCSSSRRYFSASSRGKRSKSVLPSNFARGRPKVSQKRRLANTRPPAASLRKMLSGKLSTSEWYKASLSRRASSIALLLVDVAKKAERGRVPLPVDHHRIDFGPQQVAAGGEEAEFVLMRQIFAAQTPHVAVDHHRPIFRRDDAGKGHGGQLLGLVAEHLLQLGVEELDHAILGDADGVVGVFDQQTIFLFGIRSASGNAAVLARVVGAGRA